MIMNTEIRSIIRRMDNVNNGEPWFGRSVYAILEEVDPSKAFIKPNNSSHSLVELLYHMNTWASFTLKRIEKDKENDMAAFEKLDWRELDPSVHGWEEGLKEFRSIQDKIKKLLKEKDDAFLNEKVDYRKYDFRFLINGMIEHSIYHLGQIAYIHKLLG
jgi:uncharacterized damage-inducible protein DinB